MKTWNVHCSCRYSKDYIVEAETEREAMLKADALFGEEDLENMEWVDDNRYDTWEIMEG